MKIITQENSAGKIIHLLGKTQVADLIALDKTLPKGKGGVVLNSPDPAAQFWAIQALQQHYSWIALYRPSTHTIVIWTTTEDRKLHEEIPVTLTCEGTQKEPCGQQLRPGAKYPYCSKHRDANPMRQ